MADTRATRRVESEGAETESYTHDQFDGLHVLMHLLRGVHMPPTERSASEASPLDASPGAGAALRAVETMS